MLIKRRCLAVSMNLNIDDEIYEALLKRVESDDKFSDVESYINYILRQVMARLEKEDQKSNIDEGIIRDRLQSLGYLD